MLYPVLYKKDSEGSLRYWKIWTEGPEVLTESGLCGTDSPQISSYTILVGKNIGRANETTCEEQAELESRSKWDQKREEGFILDYEEAKKVVITITGDGGIKPMKAQTYEKFATKILYPCYVQPKLDGLRCTIVKKFDSVTLYSGGGKEITTMEHIADEVRKLPMYEIILDGELYCHGMPLNEINGIVRAEKNQYDREIKHKIWFHLFDIIDFEKTFDQRLEDIKSLEVNLPIWKVGTILVNNSTEADSYYSELLVLGYEGIMYRNKRLKYQQKRSHDLIKRKGFKEEDFRIVNVEEGKGIMVQKAAALVMVNKEGTEFRAGINETHEKLQEIYRDKQNYIGKYATCRFLNYGKNNVPIIPRVTNIRLSEGVDLV